MKNIARLCKEIPCCFPHEVLGYERDSVPGLMMSFRLIEDINREANKGAKASAKSSRLNNFKQQNPNFGRKSKR